jgi:hypothetical protein
LDTILHRLHIINLYYPHPTYSWTQVSRSVRAFLSGTTWETSGSNLSGLPW